MSEYLFENNAISTLLSAINDTDVSLFLQSSDGALFPSPGAGQIFTVTLVKSDGTKEICNCTARSGDTLTVVRGQEGTAAVAFSAGDVVALRVTKAALDQYVQTDKVNTFTKTQIWSKGADLTNSEVTAGILTVGSDGNSFDYSGSEDIDGITSIGVGATIRIHFDTAVTLGYDATNFILSGGLDILTKAGDIFEFYEYAAGDFRMCGYVPVDGRYLAPFPLKNYKAGLTLSNDTDTDHDILVSVGEAADSTAVSLMQLATAMTKQIDALWVAGDDVGGLFRETLNSGINLTFNDNGGSPDDITAASGTPFAGVSVGDLFIIEDSASNNGSYVITSAVSDTVVQVATGSLTAEGPVAANAYSLKINTTYHLFLIEKDGVDSTPDIGFDTNLTAANIPSGYTKYRRISSVMTDGSANIKQFVQKGYEFLHASILQDVSANPGSTSAVNYALTVPLGIQVIAMLTFIYGTSSNTSSNIGYGIISSLDQADVAASAGNHDVMASANGFSNFEESAIGAHIRTNTSGQIRTRVSNTAEFNILKIQNRGWIDYFED